MPRWHERIHRGAAPDLLIEGVVRYRFALPLLAGAGTWIDLGCGDGCAVSRVAGEIDPQPGRTLLVDRDADAVTSAARNLAKIRPDTLVADLSAADGITALEAQVQELVAIGGRVAVTCLDTLDQISPFSGLIVWLCVQAEKRVNILLSVPNDAFRALADAERETTWGDGAFAELRSLLPPHRTYMQFPLNGSAIMPEGGNIRDRAVRTEPDTARIPSHFLIALGPLREELAPATGAALTDLSARREWERRQEASLSWLEQRVAELEVNANHDLDAGPVDQR